MQADPQLAMQVLWQQHAQQARTSAVPTSALPLFLVVCFDFIYKVCLLVNRSTREASAASRFWCCR